jgi:hypothetical protein
MADVFGNILAINNAPDRIRARQENRMRRRQQLHSRIAGAIGDTRAVQSAVRWNLYSKNPSEDAGAPIGSQHPGQAAVLAVRAALSEYNLPTQYETRWVGTSREAGRGPHHIDEGVITIEVAMHSLSGVDRYVDIPVMVREGRVLEPVCIIDRGIIKAMTQQTFDQIMDDATFTAPIPDRRNMFSPPPGVERRPPARVPLLRPGMFGFSPINRQLSAAYVKSAMQGHYAAGMPSFQSAVQKHAGGYQIGEDSAQTPSGEPVIIEVWVDTSTEMDMYYFVVKGRDGSVLYDGREEEQFFDSEDEAYAEGGNFASMLDPGRMAHRQALRDGPDHIDRAEQALPKHSAGDDVTLSAAIDIVGRDGQRWSLSAGTKGQVQRDMDGDGRRYYVYFPELGWSAPVGGGVLR